MPNISQITRTYRKTQQLTLDCFGAALVEELPDYSFTRQAVNAWESGRTKPDFEFLMKATFKYQDWRRDWAYECLAARSPDLFSSPV